MPLNGLISIWEQKASKENGTVLFIFILIVAEKRALNDHIPVSAWCLYTSIL